MKRQKSHDSPKQERRPWDTERPGLWDNYVAMIQTTQLYEESRQCQRGRIKQDQRTTWEELFVFFFPKPSLVCDASTNFHVQEGKHPKSSSERFVEDGNLSLRRNS